MQRLSAPSLRTLVVCLLLSGLVGGCDDDGPTGPSDDFDITGTWAWRVTNATVDDVRCSVTNVTLTFEYDEGTLFGHRMSPGEGNISCTINGSAVTASYTTDDDLDDLLLDGNAISFTFATTGGEWEMSGTIRDDDEMGGTATIRLRSSTGTFVLTGPWVATRV